MEKPIKRNEADFGFDIDRLEAEATSGVPYQNTTHNYEDAPPSPHKEADIEPQELHVDLNLTHQVKKRFLFIFKTFLYFLNTGRRRKRRFFFNF